MFLFFFPCKCLLGSVLISLKTSIFFLFTLSGIKQPSLHWTLMPAELGDLGRWWGHVLSVGPLGFWEGPSYGRASGLSAVSVLVKGDAAGGFLCRRRPGFAGLLLSTPFLLPQQLLGLKEDAGVNTGCSQVAVTWPLAPGVARIFLGWLKSLCWHVHLIPRVLGCRTVVLARLPKHTETGRRVNCTVFSVTLSSN